MWSLCGNDRYPYHLDIYCGKSEDPGNKFGLDGKVCFRDGKCFKGHER